MNAPVPGLAPTTYIGQDTLRPNARRLLAGRGQYVETFACRANCMPHSCAARTPTRKSFTSI